MTGVELFEMDLVIDPADAFDLSASRLVPNSPFATIGNGTLVISEGWLNMGAAILGQGAVDGDGELGTLTLKTAPTFSSSTGANIRVFSFSIGSSAQEQEHFSAEDLNLCIPINGGSIAACGDDQ